jgi:uncharacterized protein YvpB
MAVQGPVEVGFGQEVAAGFAATIAPEVGGTWTNEDSALGVAGIKFAPAGRLQAGQKYTVHITGLKRVGTGAGIPAITETFQVQSAAGVELGRPAVGEKDVPVLPKLSLKLTSKNHGVRMLRASLAPVTPDPAVPLTMSSPDDQNFVWAARSPLKQGLRYNFRVVDLRQSDPKKQTLYEAYFDTVVQPGIASARTGGHFAPGQTVDIKFDQDMKPETAPFAFSVGGKGSWADARTYKFTPDGLVPNKIYSYVVKAGLHSKAGGVTEADHAFAFATNGPVGASLSPGGSGVGVGTALVVNFDQPVDHLSAQQHFGVSPAVGGSYAWSGNTMTYNTTGLAYQTGYTFFVTPGVTPGWGLPNAQGLTGHFTTVNQIVQLNVPVFTQAFAFSCEVTSLRMLLAFRGINAAELDLVGKMGYNPRNRDTTTNTWDDPNKMFVGFINGTNWTTSYGVHSGPLATAAKTYGRNAIAYSNIDAQFIAGNIYAGNPVEFYGSIAYQHLDAWNSPDGVITAAVTMHARVVYGVEGSPQNPVGFWVNDPWGGTQYYMTAGDLMANMNRTPPISNQAVVVF